MPRQPAWKIISNKKTIVFKGRGKNKGLTRVFYPEAGKSLTFLGDKLAPRGRAIRPIRIRKR
tara:strand:- start:395 stop:580 length:186 start_codon:yes stop_codon:yes gene_type:complete